MNWFKIKNVEWQFGNNAFIKWNAAFQLKAVSSGYWLHGPETSEAMQHAVWRIKNTPGFESLGFMPCSKCSSRKFPARTNGGQNQKAIYQCVHLIMYINILTIINTKTCWNEKHRAKHHPHVKLHVNISFKIINHFQNHEYHWTQHKKIFLKHAMILEKVRVENLPDLEGSDEFVILWPQTVETDDQYCSRWWMEKEF